MTDPIPSGRLVADQVFAPGEAPAGSATITRFQIGAAVPEWLIVADPMHAQSRQGTLRFAVACDVLEAPGYFLVVPLAIGPIPEIISFDGHLCRIVAAGKPVKVVVANSTYYSAEIDAGPNGFIDPVQPAALKPAAPPPRPGFWARVRAVFAP